MAQKSSYSAEEKGAEIEEALDALDKLVDRVKVLYEQYFMGIQKQAPSHLHNDAERRIRDVMQLQIRNTALRYRFATIQQKYGTYNQYWKRSLREIEAGRYVRNLSKLRRQALQSGEALPPEIMAAMPKRMREAIERDRAQALADAQRRKLTMPAEEAVPDDAADDHDTEPTVARIAAPPPPPGARRRAAKFTTDPFAGAGDDDVAAALAGLADEALAAIEAQPESRSAPPPIPGAKPRAATTPGVAAAPRAPARSAPASAAPPSQPAAARAAPAAAPPPTARAAPPAAASRPPAAAPPATAAAARPPVPGMTEAETRALYAKYVKAREVVGDKTEGLSYEKLVRTLSNQAPKILEQHKAKGVEFNVVIRDNKVVLKAKPR